MIRRQAASLCLLTFLTANALLIGAAGLEPKLSVHEPFATMPVSPPPAIDVPETDSAQAPLTEIKQVGMASWYGSAWQGHVTASGERFDDRKMTAAHRTLPLNTQVHVTNLKTGRSVDVTITDRGPYVHGRVIDLSKAAAKKLGMVKKGLAPVQITSVAPPPAPTPASPQANTKVASLDMR